MSFWHKLEHAGSTLVHSGEHAMGIDSAISSARHHLHHWKHDAEHEAEHALDAVEGELKKAREVASHLRSQWEHAEHALQEARQAFEKEIRDDVADLEKLAKSIKKIKGMVSGITQSLNALMAYKNLAANLSQESSDAVGRIVATISGEFVRLKDRLHVVSERLGRSSMIGQTGQDTEAVISYALNELEDLQHLAEKLVDDIDTFLFKDMPGSAIKVLKVLEDFFIPVPPEADSASESPAANKPTAHNDYPAALKQTINNLFDTSKKVHDLMHARLAARQTSGQVSPAQDAALVNHDPVRQDPGSGDELVILEKRMQDHMNNLADVLDTAPPLVLTVLDRLLPISHMEAIHQQLLSVHQQITPKRPAQGNEPMGLSPTTIQSPSPIKRQDGQTGNENGDDKKDEDSKDKDSKDKDEGGPIPKYAIWIILAVITGLRRLITILDNISKVTPLGMSLKYKLNVKAIVKGAAGWAGGADAEASVEEMPGFDVGISGKVVNLATLLTSLVSGILLIIVKPLELSLVYMKLFNAIKE